LATYAEIPFGSEIDASHATIALTSALPSGRTQTGRFGGGRFQLRQGRRGYVDLYLRGRACARSRRHAHVGSPGRRDRDEKHERPPGHPIALPDAADITTVRIF
jgi:hypothetical protein